MPKDDSVRRRERNSESLAWPSVLLLGLGAVCLTGGYFNATRGRWPYFLPPQLDVFGLFFQVLGLNGSLVSTAFLCLIGVSLCTLGMFGLWRSFTT
jgi:hypothetical protein